jgi:hypothetical protein
MRVIVACETSGVVRNAFLALGHDAWSCDLLPADDRSNRHIIGDARDHLYEGWDLLMVCHPPCTRLCNSGVRWLHVPPPGKTKDQMWAELESGAALFSELWNTTAIESVCAENPVMHRYAKERIRNYKPPAQIVQPWWFGDKAFKATGLYLRNLPKLVATNTLTPPATGTAEHKAWSQVHRASPGPLRWKQRSKFWPGIAAAMAAQWGGQVDEKAAT